MLDKEYQDIKPVEYILPLINNFVKRLSGNDRAFDFQLELSKWYFENRRYGHGYICLVEAVLTRLCEIYDLDLRIIGNRNRVKSLVADRSYQRLNPSLKRLADKYHAVNDIRNRIAHAAFYSGGNYSFATDIGQAMKNYEDIRKLLNHEDINNLASSIPFDTIKNKKRFT